MSFEAAEELLEGVRTLHSQAARDQFLAERIAELQSATEGDGDLDILFQLAELDPIVDPTLDQFEDYTFPNLAPVIRVQILRAEVGLLEGRRDELHKLLDLYQMLHRWRWNQKHMSTGIVGLACTREVDAAIVSLADRGLLLAEDAQRVQKILQGRCPARIVAVTSIVNYAHIFVESMAALRKQLGGESQPLLGRIFFNVDKTEHYLLSHLQAIIEAIQQGRFAEAEELDSQFVEWANRPLYLRPFNWGGFAAIAMITPSRGSFAAETEAQEAALLKRVKELVGDAGATP